MLEEKECPHCQQPNANFAFNCRHCGLSLTGSAESGTAAGQKRRKQSLRRLLRADRRAGRILRRPLFWMLLLALTIIIYLIIPAPAWPIIIFALLAMLILVILMWNR